MKKIIFPKLFLILVLYNCIVSLSAQEGEEKRNPGWGFDFKLGYSQYLSSGSFANYLKNSAGIHFQIDLLYKRFALGFGANGNLTRVKNQFDINNSTINVNDKVDLGMVGFFLSYAAIYNDFMKISPVAGPSWCGLSKGENVRAKNIFTGTIGFQFELCAPTSLGGLTGGLCMPLYLKYNYCFPKKYTNDINSGMHFITIGLELYIKDNDK